MRGWEDEQKQSGAAGAQPQRGDGDDGGAVARDQDSF
jgi:hypothetical protein